MFERCQLLVRITDKTNPECPYRCAQLHKAGDVIVIVEYEHRWSPAEVANPDWLILKVAGEHAIEECRSLTTPELHTDPASRSRVLQKRGFRLDLDRLTLMVPTEDIDVPIDTIKACKVQAEPLKDPNVAS